MVGSTHGMARGSSTAQTGSFSGPSGGVAKEFSNEKNTDRVWSLNPLKSAAIWSGLGEVLKEMSKSNGLGGSWGEGYCVAEGSRGACG